MKRGWLAKQLDRADKHTKMLLWRIADMVKQRGQDMMSWLKRANHLPETERYDDGVSEKTFNACMVNMTRTIGDLARENRELKAQLADAERKAVERERAAFYEGVTWEGPEKPERDLGTTVSETAAEMDRRYPMLPKEQP